MANQILKRPKAVRGEDTKVTFIVDTERVLADESYVRPAIFEQRAREMKQLLETSPIPKEFLKKQ